MTVLVVYKNTDNPAELKLNTKAEYLNFNLFSHYWIFISSTWTLWFKKSTDLLVLRKKSSFRIWFLLHCFGFRFAFILHLMHEHVTAERTKPFAAEKRIVQRLNSNPESRNTYLQVCYTAVRWKPQKQPYAQISEGHDSLIVVQTWILTERVRGDYLRSAINKCCLTELAWELCAALEHGKEGEKPWCTYGSAAPLPRFDRRHTRLHWILAEDLGAARRVNGWD